MSTLHKDPATVNKIAMKNALICSAKQKLAATDYKALKFAEGELTAEEYAPIREERRVLRVKINTLEAEVKQLEG